jgi:arginyl-tRNA synthetase
LADLGIVHDVFSSERQVREDGKIEATLKTLESKGLIYQGVLEPPKGKMPDDWEPREQTLFRSTTFGDDVDRALKKSDGSYTYFAPDIAYHLDKIERGFNKMVLILGADHGGYIKRMKAAVSALSDNKADLDIKISQLVNFMEGGVPMKMSKRAGTFTTVRDVIDEVGKEVIRFIMLTRKNDAVLDFDLKLVKEQSKLILHPSRKLT